MKVEELDFDALSDINVRFARVPSRRWDYISYLIVGYIGTYRSGSAGNPDARYMTAMAEAGLAAFGADGIIHDCSCLKYEWGDEIEQVFGAGVERQSYGSPFPFGIIVGPGCASALATLEWGVNTRKLITECDEVFESLQETVAYLDSFDPRNGEPSREL